MKYAASIKYGGQLIDVLDADHNSYKHLGLLCPECKNPVFLREGHRRTAPKSKEIIEVDAAFAHFKAQDPAIALACEKRVARYDRKELEKRATAARNQRLKLLQRWFWDIFWRRLELDQNFENAENKEFFQRDLPLKAPIICAHDESLVALLESLPPTHSHRDQQCRVCIDGFKSKHYKGNPFQSERIVKGVEFLSLVDRQMQIMICTEVLDFLFSKSSRHLLFQVLVVLWLRVIDSSTRKEKLIKHYGTVTNAIYAELILEVCWTDWAGEFEQLKN